METQKELIKSSFDVLAISYTERYREFDGNPQQNCYSIVMEYDGRNVYFKFDYKSRFIGWSIWP